jgi:ubiquinone/menaquinone biosynthesis C-methylase UbiE
MDFMNSETHTTWNKLSKAYHEKFSDTSEYEESLSRFLDLIENAEPKLLEIGCGPGNLTTFLHNKRQDINITAIDYASNMISLAKEVVPAVNFIEMDARNIHNLKDKFDAIICGFCIPYLSKADVQKFISDCNNLLEKGGVLYASFIEGDHRLSGYKTSSTGDRAYTYFYQKSDVTALTVAMNFELIASYRFHKVSRDAMPADECIVILQKMG